MPKDDTKKTMPNDMVRMMGTKGKPKADPMLMKIARARMALAAKKKKA